MKRSIAILLGLTLAAGAGLAQAGRGGGPHGGGGRAVAMGGRPAPSGGFTHFTTGPMRFTTGPMHFTTGPHPIGRPPGIIARPFPVPIHPVHPIHSHPVIVSGGIVVAAPFWFPPPPYPYYPYPYVAPVAGGPAYVEAPAYSDAQPYADTPNSDTPGYAERNDYWYYCPDSQAYYPYVQTCASPWVPVLPQPDGTAN
ncbi:MAG TPA: hypothetical protein VFK92_07530 [Burkholderiales bacterium]|nr:hypothetical protein [Burkholderiales bacterium]